MATVVIDYPITTRHSRGGERIIPFSPGSAAGSGLLGRERFSSNLLLSLAALLTAAACASSSPTPAPTETPSPVRPTVTPIPIGGADSSVCDPQGIIFGKDGKPSLSLTEKIIEEFNACVLAKKASAEATATDNRGNTTFPATIF